MYRVALLALVVAVLAGPAGAQYIDQTLSDPALEQRALRINKDIQCLVCQNQAISDSNATLAQQLRVIVRERVAAGDTDTEVKAYLVDRYGDWVLMRPPLKASTAILWAAPFAILGAILAGVAIFVIRRRKRQTAPLDPLSAEEEARLAAILHDRT